MRKIAMVSVLGLALAGLGIAAVQAQQAVPASPDSQLAQPVHWRGDDEGNRRHEGRRHHRHGDDRFDRRGDDGPRGGMMRRMEQFDTNKDGALTQAEIDAFNQAQITRFDADRNGTLSLSEYQSLWLDQMRERTVRAFQRNDRDGDGQVTPDELNGRFADVVERFDRNGDGQLSRDDRGGPRRGAPPAAPAPEQPAPAPAPQAAPAPAPAPQQ